MPLEISNKRYERTILIFESTKNIGSFASENSTKTLNKWQYCKSKEHQSLDVIQVFKKNLHCLKIWITQLNKRGPKLGRKIELVGWWVEEKSATPTPLTIVRGKILKSHQRSQNTNYTHLLLIKGDQFASQMKIIQEPDTLNTTC